MAGSLKKTKVCGKEVSRKLKSTCKKSKTKRLKQDLLYNKVNYAKRHNKHTENTFQKTLGAALKDFEIEKNKIQNISQPTNSELRLKTFKLINGAASISPKKILHPNESHKSVNGVVVPSINPFLYHDNNKRTAKLIGMKNDGTTISRDTSSVICTPGASLTDSIPQKMFESYVDIIQIDSDSDSTNSIKQSNSNPEPLSVHGTEIFALDPPPSPTLNLTPIQKKIVSAFVFPKEDSIDTFTKSSMDVTNWNECNKSVSDILGNLDHDDDESSGKEDLMITNVWSMSEGDPMVDNVKDFINSSPRAPVQTPKLIGSLKKPSFISQNSMRLVDERLSSDASRQKSPIHPKICYSDPEPDHHQSKKRKRSKRKSNSNAQVNIKKRKKHEKTIKLKIKLGHNRVNTNESKNVDAQDKVKVKRRLKMLQKERLNEVETTSGSNIEHSSTSYKSISSIYKWQIGKYRSDNDTIVPTVPVNDNESSPLRSTSLENNHPAEILITNNEGGMSSHEESVPNTSQIPSIFEDTSNNSSSQHQDITIFATPKRVQNRDSLLEPFVVLADVLPALTPNQKSLLLGKKDRSNGNVRIALDNNFADAETISPLNVLDHVPDITVEYGEEDTYSEAREPDLYDFSVRQNPPSARKLRLRAAPLQVEKIRGDVIYDIEDIKVSEKRYRSFRHVRLKKLGDYNEIVITVESVVKKKREIKLHREYNFFCAAALRDIINALNICKKQKRCKAVLLSSVGPIFSSGLNPIELLNYSAVVDPSHDIIGLVEQLIDVLIEFDKPLIGAVQGPAVGFGASLLLFCDSIYASERAHFQFPFVQMGLSPCGCVTSLLPQAVGSCLARSLLLQGKLLTAEQALNFGFVTELFPHDTFMRHVVTACESMALTVGTILQDTKQLLRPTQEFEQLRKCSANEIAALKHCLKSNDCQTRLQTYILTQLHME